MIDHEKLREGDIIRLKRVLDKRRLKRVDRASCTLWLAMLEDGRTYQLNEANRDTLTSIEESIRPPVRVRKKKERKYVSTAIGNPLFQTPSFLLYENLPKKPPGRK